MTEKEFRCPKCVYSTKNVLQFLEHLETYHPGEADIIVVNMVKKGEIKVEVA